MAPLKRAWPGAVGEESDDEDVRNHNTHKRRRQPERATSPSDDSDVECDYSQAPLRGNREAYERERDEIETDTEEDNEIEKRATQDIQRSRNVVMENQPQDAGIIETLTCINFMCHTKLQVTLGPLINFIIGHNGSGKSAILTGITLCLGGKATATNRGQSLKGFVKEGQESSTLIIKIKNRGEGSFQHDVYGDSIIVERHFTINGTSGFKLKTATGKVVSTKRAMLDEITDFYALQLENPVNVLTQDMARQFLNSSSNYEKYKFFMKGIQLEQLDHDYTLLSDSLDGVDAHLESLLDDENALKAKVDQAEKRLKQCDRQDNLREKMNLSQRQMAWAQVEEQERNEEQARHKVEGIEAKLAQRVEDFDNMDESYQRADQAWEAAKAKLEEVKEERSPLADQVSEAKAAYNEKDTERVEIQTQQRDVAGQLRRAKQRAAELEQKVNDERKRLEAADGGNQARMLQDIEAAETEAAEAKRKYDDHPAGRNELDRNLKTAELKHSDAAEALQRKQAEVADATTRLRSFQQGQGAPLAAYHNSIHSVIREINAERRWKVKPVGPLGEHLRLLKPEWSSIIEAFFGNALGSFVVEQKSDQALLSAIMQRCQYRGAVNIVTSRPTDTSRHEPDANFDTVMRILQIDNEQVRNLLIINHSMEQVVLIADRNEAFHTMYENGAPPRNCKFSFCFHPTRRGYGLRLVGGGNTRTDPVNKYQGTPRIKTDTEAQIRVQQQLVDGLKRELQPLEAAVTGFRNDLQRCNQAIARHTKEGDALRIQQKRTQQTVQKLKEELEAAIPQDGVLDALKDQLQQVEGERDHMQSQYEVATENKAQFTAELAELQKAVDATSAKLGKYEERFNRAGQALRAASDRRQIALRTKNEGDNLINDVKREKAEADDALQRAAQVVEEFTTEASKFCARVTVPAGETTNSLDKKLTEMEKQLTAAQQALGGDRATLATRLAEATQRYSRARNNHQNIHKLRQELLQILAERKLRWKRFRQHISARARSHFVYLLAERSFRGRMQIHHTAKQLELLVEPDNTAVRTDAGRGTKTLSGGEKSFSTICMLLAMWDAMGSPIRCLDEFDVFMDNVNRDISMKMMIGAARRSVGKQYVLISPQAMGNVQLGQDVKVIRLSDPERGQRVIGAGGRVE